MKHLKYYKTFERILADFTLYHGSPYLFEKFKNRTTYFSDNPNFAWEYADEKSFDATMDAEPIIYKCKLNGKIFDATIDEHLQKLNKVLPEKITCYMSNFCFPYDYTKKDILNLLKGDDVIEPIDYIANAKVGDEVPDPSYNADKLIVVRVDNENVYTIDKKNFSYYLNGASNIGTSGNFGYEYRKHFEDFRNYVKTVLKKSGKYIDSDQMKFIFFNKQYQKIYNIDVTDEELTNGQNLYDIGYSATLKEYSDKYAKSWTKNPKPIKLDDTWRYYENDVVANEIKKLGFAGYVAREKKHNTYAIYNPEKTITIKSITYEGNEFNNIEEIKEYNKINNMLYNHYKSISKYNRYDVFNFMKNGLTYDEMVKTIDKQNI
jgi:hypothetical protein